jgi:hypothetical protein
MQQNKSFAPFMLIYNLDYECTKLFIAEPNVVKSRVFLSSVFVDDFDGEQKYVPLREQIIETKSSFPIKLWVYEHFWPKNTEFPKPDADTIIDRCFRGIRDCDLFVFLLTGRHGSGVSYVKDLAQATYLELELFAAAMLRKPILVLHLSNHEPQPALRDTLNLFNREYASGQYVVDDENGLFKQFRDACDQLAAGTWTPVYDKVLAKLPDRLSNLRTRTEIEEELSHPRLWFLDGQLRSDQSNANPDKAKQLLDQVASGVRGDAPQTQLMPHGAALFRL